MTNFSMPKSCISCDCYSHKGYAKDKHSPFKDLVGNAKNNGRVQYGSCTKHRSEVFATEICNTYESMKGITVVEVMNRPIPKEARQERLF